MSSCSSTSCSSDANRAARDDGQRQRGTGALPVSDSASALASLPLLKPKQSQIVRYMGNHGGDLWSETRCVSHGTLRDELHVVQPYPLDKVLEKVIFIIFYIFFYNLLFIIFIFFYINVNF